MLVHSEARDLIPDLDAQTNGKRGVGPGALIGADVILTSSLFVRVLYICYTIVYMA